ncbi:DUF559 domain-containing protein [Allobranchiibius sp. GilTou73]|uniref:DUF559 domain-containing protein n=1 Tax=Allobranchiibius sp. GilTou73 TaxID=2904523 RepID=UPI001F1C2A7A|nr:DUF559 domain-containing protein [Allobranchiibius sp. GilTou73]UIJ34667.1 DUF559 domain-containing protein [Allobranchiibius sp. GilTou73]
MRRRPLPRELDEAFSRAQAMDAGVRPKRLEAGDLTRPFRGVRTTSPAVDLESRARALLTVLPDRAVFSHASAALLWGIPLPRRLESGEDLHITLPAGASTFVRGGVVVHDGDRDTTKCPAGLSVTAPGATWCDLSAGMAVDDLVIAGDDLCFRSLTDRAGLQAALVAHPGRRGRVAARSALPLIRDGSASPGETRTRLLLGRWGLPEPELNADVFDRSGGWLARVDFLWRAHNVVAEYYGAVHEKSWGRDLTRAAQLEDAGYRVVVITARDLRGGAGELRARLARLIVP